MKIIKDGIAFSDDIERILKGNNALEFSYIDNGMVLPSAEFFKELRKSFFDETNEIFEGKAKILRESEMLEGINESILDVLGRYPPLYH